jgi:hypothetical protein
VNDQAYIGIAFVIAIVLVAGVLIASMWTKP